MNFYWSCGRCRCSLIEKYLQRLLFYSGMQLYNWFLLFWFKLNRWTTTTVRKFKHLFEICLQSFYVSDQKQWKTEFSKWKHLDCSITSQLHKVRLWINKYLQFFTKFVWSLMWRLQKAALQHLMHCYVTEHLIFGWTLLRLLSLSSMSRFLSSSSPS